MAYLPTATIKLAALRHNLAVVHRYAPDAKVMAVIKANGYGHGVLEVARALTDADMLAVARMSEAVALRDAGIAMPILVLEGASDADDLRVAIERNIEIVVHHLSQVELVEQYPECGVIDCWLKVDSGMHRLGVTTDAAPELAHRLEACVRRLAVLSHLANADDPADDYTLQQRRRFVEAVEHIDGERSLANSAGVLAWPTTHFDWVRPGLMLYGASPLVGKTAEDLDLQPVMTLTAPLIAIQSVAAGEPVGYGGTWRAPHDMAIGVVGIGYGDGYPRHVREGTPVLLNGQKAPLIARVSMDMITIDLTGIDATIGDTATLWGDALPVEQIAAGADTIAYTLLCGVAGRVNYVYEHG